MNIDFQSLRNELEDLNIKLSDPSSVPPRERGQMFARQAQLHEVFASYESIESRKKQLNETEELLSTTTEEEMKTMARQEIENLTEEIDSISNALKALLIPPDPNDSRNCLLEIRAGTGGEEAALFVADLLRMYSRFATLQRWSIRVLSITPSEGGGVKEVIGKIEGKNVYRILKTESGVHRVQRVPETEASGRIHTSAASVVIMPEIDDIDININPNDLKIDVYRSSGHGGQSVNTTDSAVRITHLPTGIVVTCQDTKEQQKNKASAMSVLKAKLYQIELEKQQSEVSDLRKHSIKTGDRSDKIKTYNFPQDRLTDHRIKKSWFGLDPILKGEIEDVIQETYLNLQAD